MNQRTDVSRNDLKIVLVAKGLSFLVPDILTFTKKPTPLAGTGRPVLSGFRSSYSRA
jgi:hypothetical protein